MFLQKYDVCGLRDSTIHIVLICNYISYNMYNYRYIITCIIYIIQYVYITLYTSIRVYVLHFVLATITLTHQYILKCHVICKRSRTYMNAHSNPARCTVKKRSSTSIIILRNRIWNLSKSARFNYLTFCFLLFIKI